MDLTASLLGHLAAWGLPGGPSAPRTARGVSPESLAAAAERQRLTGVALAALDAGALADPVDPFVEALLPPHRDLLRGNLAAEANLVEVARLLGRHGIELRVLKGLATAHLDHTDPAARITSDTDVLVPVGSIAQVAELLEPYVNHTTTIPDRAPSWRARFGKDLTVELASGGWIDVHQRLIAGYFGQRIPMAEIWADPEPFQLAGERLLALPPPMRLLHAGIHAAQRNTGPHSSRDVLVLAGRDDVEWRQVVTLAERWGVDALFARGVARAWSSFPVEQHPLALWAADHRVRRRQRFALWVHDRWAGNHFWTTPLALPLTDWPAFIGPMLWPSDEYLAHYDRTRWQHLMRPVRKFFRRPVR